MMKKNSFSWLFVAAIVGLPLTVFAVVKWYENNFQRLPVLGPQNQPAIAYKMQNQFGATVTEANARGKIAVTEFFFTHCPSICPKMTRNMKRVQQAYSNDEGVIINSFSVDPVRDSVERLQAYATQFNITGRWNLLTGDKKEIYRLARKRFFVDATDGDGGPGDFIHSDKFILTDGEGRIRGYYNGTNETEVEQLIKDIARLKKEQRG
jgi:protein SCO1